MLHTNPDLLIDLSVGTEKTDLLIAPSNQILVCKELLLIIDLQSITQIRALPGELRQSNPDLQVPAKQIVLWTYKQGAYLELDHFLAVHYSNPYRENLLSYFTARDELILAPEVRVALSVRDCGTGVLGTGDRLRVFGHCFTTATVETDIYFEAN